MLIGLEKETVFYVLEMHTPTLRVENYDVYNL